MQMDSWPDVQDCMLSYYYLFYAEKINENKLLLPTSARACERDHTCARACEEEHKMQPYQDSPGIASSCSLCIETHP